MTFGIDKINPEPSVIINPLNFSIISMKNVLNSPEVNLSIVFRNLQVKVVDPSQNSGE